MSIKSIKAFSSKKIDFYKLLKDLPTIDKGAVFYWDKYDNNAGSPAEGCLKLCWRPDGDCYTKGYQGYCGGTIILHADARLDKKWFKKIKKKEIKYFMYEGLDNAENT